MRFRCHSIIFAFPLIWLTFFLISAIKGNKIRGTIFNEDIEPLKQTLQRGGTYLISNAIVERGKPSYQQLGTALHLTFKQETRIEEVEEDNTSLLDQIYDFTPLSLCKNYYKDEIDLSMSMNPIIT